MADYNTAEPYKYGFTTDVEMEQFPPGLNEQVITAISEKKNEPQWLLDWRLKAYSRWLKMEEPKHWPNITYPTSSLSMEFSRQEYWRGLQNFYRESSQPKG